MSTAATETRPEVKAGDLPALDRAPITAEAETWLADLIESTSDQVERARLVLNAWAQEADLADKTLAERDAVVWTLLTTHWLRRGASLAEAIGTNRSGLKKVKDRQEKVNPDLVADPVEKLPGLAREAMVHASREVAARPARDKAIAFLVNEAGWSNVQVAELMPNRDPSRVSHIKFKEGKAA